MQPETLPDGWTEVRFDEMAAMVSKRVDPAETDLDVYVGLEHIEPETLRIKEHGAPSDVKGQKLRFRPGHIIFGKRRAYQRKLAVAEVDGICSAHAMVLEAKPDVVHPDFLPFFMQSDLFMDRAVQISVGGLSPTINWKTLRKQTFALPPMDRQRELVEVFRGVEDVLMRQEEAVAAAISLRRSVLYDLVKPRPEWSEHRLGEVADIQLGKKLSPAERTGRGTRSYLRSANVNHGEIDFDDMLEMDFNEREFEFYRLRPGDCLMVEGSANVNYVGDPALYTGDMPDDVCFQMTLLRARAAIEELEPAFLYPLLRYLYGVGEFRRVAVGTDIQHLSASRTETVPVRLPPIEHQRKAVVALAACDEALSVAQKHAEQMAVTKRQILTSLLDPSVSKLVEVA